MPTSRILWLDAARAALMLLGVVLHAAQVFADPAVWLVSNDDTEPGFSLLVWIIHIFRMPAFFIIAGFFCAYAWQRFGADGFLRNRLSRIGIPLLATALTFNLWQDIFLFVVDERAGSVAQYVTSGRLAGFATQGGWQGHLWFLTFLLIYHLLFAVAALARACLPLALPRLPPALLGSPYLLALACIVPPALASLVPSLWAGIGGILTGYHLLFHLPFFAFGILAFHHRPALDAFARLHPADLPLLAAAILVAFLEPQPTGTALDTALHIYATGLCAWLLARLTFVACRRLVTGGRLARYLSDAAFSFYLCHHLLIVVGGWLLAQLAWPVLLEYLLLVIAASAIALALHHFLVLRHPILRLLFNGQFPRPPPRPPLAPPLRPAPHRPIIPPN